MIQSFVQSCIHQRKMVLLLALMLFFAGLHAATILNVEAYPDPAPPLLEIIAQNSGWSAEEMEQQITVPLESSLNGMAGLDHIRSESLFGLSDIKCYFGYSTDFVIDRQEVLNRIAMTNLPAGVQAQLSPESTIGEILRYELVGPNYTQMQLKELNDWLITRQFKQVPGVIDLVSFGGPTKEYHVDLDPSHLIAYHVSIGQVMTAISNANLNVGASYLDVGSQSYNIRGIGLFKTPEDIANVVVTEKSGVPIYVRQLGTVQLGRKMPLGRVGRDYATDIVDGVVLMRVGGQSMPTLKGVNAKIKDLNERILPKGVKIATYADRTDLINITTHTVYHTLISGMLLVFFILMAFLGDLRASIIVAVTIPLCLCVVFVVMTLTGQSANLISMGAIDFGIIVDASVILIENVHRHLSFRDPQTEGIESIVSESAGEVVNPIFFSTMVIFVSFLPLFTMQGVEGKIFGPMALTYALALAAALMLALSFSPAAATQVMKGGSDHAKDTFLVRLLRRPYMAMLNFCIDHSAATVGGAIVLLLLVLFLVVPRLGGEFMPKLEEGNLWVRATMPTSISYTEATRVADKCRSIFLQCPQVTTVVSQLGRPDDGSDPTSFFNCEFYVPLTSRDTWPAGLVKEKIIAELEKKLDNTFPGVSFNFSQNIEDNVEEAMSGVKGENSIKVVGEDLGQLESLASQIEAAIKPIDGVKDLGIFHVLGQPNLLITPDREAIARYGMQLADVNNAVGAAIGGTAVTQVLLGDRRFDVVVRFQQAFRDTIGAISKIPIATDAGVLVPLPAVATIKATTGAGFIYREDNQRYIPIKFSVRDRDLTSTIADIQAAIAKKVHFPSGYSMQISGQFEQLQAATGRLKVIIPVTLFLILLILSRSFASTLDASVVLSTIPMAAVGGVMALFLRGITMSISAGVGFISLAGVCTLEGVLLVSRIKQNLHEGMAPHEAILHAGELRLRPVLMVALGAAIGLMPAATASGIGSETQRPLATVVVGGMLSSLAVILLVLPAVYRLLHRDKAILEE